MNRRLETWGGLECSVVRVAGQVRNQLIETGHVIRGEKDIKLIAKLGIKTLRYPVLWETVEKKCGTLDWRWHDKMLFALKAAGISVVAGLIHHGSGPSRTHLLDPAFPKLLAEFGEQVARRYPWISNFTPINEPLTTARFASLYGHWEPHFQNEDACLRMAVAESRAIAKCMNAIRSVTPSARLVQTEDVGRIFSTAALKYQADYENDRRWLSLDLLVGNVDVTHPLYCRLINAGVLRAELDKLIDRPCCPNLIGVDYYLTSDRFLDDRLSMYPTERIGGNGHQRYVDVAATRVSALNEQARLSARLNEVWDRYHVPLAVTEIHNGSTRDDQVRWLFDAVNEATLANAAGADVRAVTAWALFGSYDWNSLLTDHAGYYEPGAFDVRGAEPRQTALASAITALCAGTSYDHPLLDHGGWWQSPSSRGGRELLISGDDDWVELISSRCRIRRLNCTDVRSITREIWARVHACSDDGDVEISAVHGDGKSMTLILPRHLSKASGVDAFLDLLIDGLSGAFILTKATRANQHEFLPLAVKVKTYPSTRVHS